MTLLVRQQNVSAISSPGCDSAGNIYYQCKAELFLPSAWAVTFIIFVSVVTGFTLYVSYTGVMSELGE